MIIGISGKAGAGKDTVSDLLVKYHLFVRVALADPLKRICKEVFDFSDEQLWGPSEERNKPDERYPRTLRCADRLHPDSPDHSSFLTPRYALQQLGTEWGRDCYDMVWVNYMLRTAKTILEKKYGYSMDRGLNRMGWIGDDPVGVCVPDVRFKNEMDAIREAGGKVVRIRRPEAGLGGAAGQHASEAEQDEVPDSYFDCVIENVGSLEQLEAMVKEMMEGFNDPTIKSSSLSPVGSKTLLTDDFLSRKFPDVALAVANLKGLRKLEKTRPYEEEEVVLPEATTTLDDGSQIIPAGVTKDQELLSDLLGQRQKDVEAGKILPYDAAQEDIPPHLRKK